MKPFLFNEPLLPVGFVFPQEYEALVTSASSFDIEPWKFLAEDKPMSLCFYGEMMIKFPDAPLVPFAYVDDQSGLFNDGWTVLACFDASDTLRQPRIRIYDFSTPTKTPWENLSYDSFNDWFAAAQDESKRFKENTAELDR